MNIIKNYLILLNNSLLSIFHYEKLCFDKTVNHSCYYDTDKSAVVK